MKQASSTQKTYMNSLPKGADINIFLKEFAIKNNIQTASLNFIGSLEQVSLGFYDQTTRKYNKKDFFTPFEIVSGTGNISLKDGEVFIHSHVILSDKNYQVIGGHLFNSKVFAGEYVIYELPELLLKRNFDKTTGLSLWNNNQISK